MIDPSKLIASATRLYGSDMDRLWGEFLPVPDEALVKELADTLATLAGERLN